MALDFKLNLILPQQNARIFCRSNIEATCYLIKQYLPQIAISLHRTLDKEPLPLNEEHIESIYQQTFFIDLPLQDVSKILEVLGKLTVEETDNKTPGLTVLARSLHLDWLELASCLDIIDD